MKARIGDGNGIAAARVSKIPKVLLGYKPYPGTLNIRACRGEKLIDLSTPPIYYEGIRLWPIFVNDIEGHVVRWKDDKRVESFEIIAPVRLRDHLKLRKYDYVHILRR